MLTGFEWPVHSSGGRILPRPQQDTVLATHSNRTPLDWLKYRNVRWVIRRTFRLRAPGCGMTDHRRFPAPWITPTHILVRRLGSAKVLSAGTVSPRAQYRRTSGGGGHAHPSPRKIMVDLATGPGPGPKAQRGRPVRSEWIRRCRKWSTFACDVLMQRRGRYPAG